MGFVHEIDCVSGSLEVKVFGTDSSCSKVGEEDNLGADLDEFLHHLYEVQSLNGQLSRVADEDDVGTKGFHGCIQLVPQNEPDQLALVPLHMPISAHLLFRMQIQADGEDEHVPIEVRRRV